jgi:hypothetical protein
VLNAQRHALIAIVPFTQHTGFQNSLCQLFDEQRNAVRAAHDLGQNRLRQSLLHKSLGKCSTLALAEAAEREVGDVLMVGPWRTEFGSGGYQQQQAPMQTSIDRAREELERGGIEPMHILEHEQQRLVASKLTP